MSVPYYSNPERAAELVKAALSLKDTPFVPHAMIPGAGIDCVHVNGWCYLQTKLFSTFEPPKYAVDSGNHAKESQLLKWLDANPRFQKLSGYTLQPSTLMAGDTICFNMNLSEHHVGIMSGSEQFVHCLFFGPKRVIVSSFAEHYYARRVSAVYRPMTGGASC